MLHGVLQVIEMYILPMKKNKQSLLLYVLFCHLPFNIWYIVNVVIFTNMSFVSFIIKELIKENLINPVAWLKFSLNKTGSIGM